MSALINIFESAFNDIHRQIKVESGLRVEEIENLDWENCLIFVNGFERKKEYKIRDNDVVTIRQFPSDSKASVATVLGWVFLPVTSGVHYFVTGESDGAIMWFGRTIDQKLHDMFDPPKQQTTGQGESIPTISGAKNRSGANQPIPLLIGESMYTPITLAQGYTDIDPSDGSDGEKQYFHGLYCLGYRNIDLKSVSLGIYKLSVDEHNGTSGELDCQNTESYTDTQNFTFKINSSISGNVLTFTPNFESGTELVSINSIGSNTLTCCAVVKYVKEKSVTVPISSTVIDGNSIVVTATEGYSKYAFDGTLVLNCTVRVKAVNHYPLQDTSSRQGYHQQLELQQNLDENGHGSEVALYPQKVVMENFGTELMHPEGVAPLVMQPFSAKYPQKIQLEVMFQNLVHFKDDGGQESTSVTLCIGYSLDGGLNYLPFESFIASSSAITITNLGTVTDSQGTYRKVQFSGKKNKAMRFIAEKTFTFDEVFNIPEGTVKCKNNVIEFKIWRVNVDVSVTDSKYQYKCFFNAIRTWCYDYKKTLAQYEDDIAEGISTHSLVIQRPVIEKYRDMTARLGFTIRAGEEINGTLDELNVIMESRARYCTITYDGDDPTYTWSDIDDTRPTNNPASLALMILQHEMRGEYAYIGEQGDVDKYFDMDSFGAFYEWCEQTDTGFINSEDRKYTANGVISKQFKTIDIVNQILNCGHGRLVINGNKYGVLYDKPETQPVMILNNQNVLDAKNTKAFAEEIDGFSARYIDCLNDYQEDTQIFVPNDIKDPTSPNYKDPSEYKLENIELPWITDAKRAFRMCMYMLACRKLRPESWEVKMSVDGYMLDVGSLVSYQSDTLAVGIGDGAQIVDVITEGGYITSIVLDFGFNVADITKEYGVKVQHSDPTNGVKIRVYKLADFTSVGNKKVLVFDDPIDTATVVKPAVGDIVSFGLYGRETTDAIVLTKKSNSDGTFTFVLVPYQEDIYASEYGDIPEFQTNVTSPKDAGQEVSEDLPPVTRDDVNEIAQAVIQEGTDTPPSAPTNLSVVAEEIGVQLKWTPVSQNGINNTIKHYVVEISKDGGSTWTVLGTTFNSDYMYVFRRTASNPPVQGEIVDGYPEKADFDDWKFRVKAVNIYGYSSTYLAGYVNTDDYGTWIIPPLVISTEVIDRTAIITAVYGGSDKVYGKLKTQVRISRRGNTYPVGDTPTPTYNDLLKIEPDVDEHSENIFYEPEFSQPVQPNGNTDNEVNYRKNTQGYYETSGNKISQTLPLIGQTPRMFKDGEPLTDSQGKSLFTKDVPDVASISELPHNPPQAGDIIHWTGDDYYETVGDESELVFAKDGYYLYETDWVQVYSKQMIVPTMYLYEIRMTNGVNTRTANPIVIEALGTNIADIVHSHEHYKDLYVEKLSAINANLGMISQGGMGSFVDNDNCWALSDISAEDSGVAGGVLKGTFRVGDNNEYFRVTPHKRGDGTRYYSIELKAGNIELTSATDEQSTMDFMNGTYVYNSDRTARMMLSPSGIIVQKYNGTDFDKWSDSTKIEDVSKVFADEKGNMIISNSNDIPPFGYKVNGSIYHFDDPLNPEDEEVPEGQSATNPEDIECTGSVVGTEGTNPLLDSKEASKFCFEGTVAKDISNFEGEMVFFNKAEKIVIDDDAIDIEGTVERDNASAPLVGYNEAMKEESSVDPTLTLGEYLGLDSTQIQNGIFY